MTHRLSLDSPSRTEPVTDRRPFLGSSAAPVRPVLTLNVEQASPRFSWALGLVLVTALAACVRLWQLDLHRLWLDEGFVAVAALRSPGHLWLDLPRIEPHPPLFFLIEHWWTSVAGLGIIALRLPSALAATLSVPLGVFLLRRWIGPFASIVAGLGIALNPLLVWYAQEARMYSLLGLELLASIYLLDRAFTAPRGKRAFSFLLISLVLEAAALYTHYLGSLVPIAQLLVLLARRPAPPWLSKSWLVGQVLLLASWLPWLVFWGVLASPGVRSEEALRPLDAGVLVARLLSFGSAFPTEDPLNSWVPTLVALAALGALVSMFVRRARNRGLLAVELVSGLGFLVALYFAVVAGSYTGKALVLFVPIILGLMAAPLAQPSRFRAPLTVVLLLGLVGPEVAGLAAYFDTDRYAKWYSYEAAAEAVQRHLGADDLLLEADLDPSFRYYAGLPGPPVAALILPHAVEGQDEVLWTERPAQPGGKIAAWSWSPRFETVSAEIAAVGATYDNVWFALNPTTSWWDTRGAAREELRRQLWARERIPPAMPPSSASSLPAASPDPIRSRRQPVSARSSFLAQVACSRQMGAPRSASPGCPWPSPPDP